NLVRAIGRSVEQANAVCLEIPLDAVIAAIRVPHETNQPERSAVPRAAVVPHGPPAVASALGGRKAVQRTDQRVVQGALARLVIADDQVQPGRELEWPVQRSETLDLEALNPHKGSSRDRQSPAVRPRERAGAFAVGSHPPLGAAPASSERKDR